MRRAAVMVAGIALAVAACAPGARAPGHPASGPAEVAWVAGPTPDVRSLVLRPAPVGELTAGSCCAMELSVGAFLAEMGTGPAARHQLALLLQLDGENPALSLDLTRGLLVEMDGAVYVGDPGPGGEGYHVQGTLTGRRLSVSIPVAMDDLRRIIRAGEVRIRLGGSEPLPLSPADRDRLRLLVEQLPSEVSFRVGPRHLALATED